MFRLRRSDWIILTAFIVAGVVGYGIYSKWAEAGSIRAARKKKGANR